MLKILITGIIFTSLNLYADATVVNTRYSAYFKTEGSLCILSVNGLDYLSTLDGPRTISTGSDITDALENNNKNSIGLIFYPSKSKKIRDNYSCEVKVIKSTPDKPDEIITNFKIVFDGKNNRQFTDPDGYSIQDISDTIKSKIIKGISNRITFEGHTKANDWLTASRDFIASGIPEWKWTKAIPQNNDSELRNKLIVAYKDLISDLEKNDIQTIKKKYSIALYEYAKADLTDDTDLFFDSIGIVDAMEEGKIKSHAEWNNFKVLTYQKGRIFCLGVGGASRRSPLQFFNEKGEHIFSWNPFFAMIDGKMTLVR